MADRPIIFSAPMVRALLDGRKTQTRRLAWRDCSKCPGVSGCKTCGGKGVVPTVWQKARACDRLWVRETADLTGSVPRYKADNPPAFIRWTPSIHMPRWASRLTLMVTATKIERVQEISEEDAIAEKGFKIATPDDLIEAGGVADDAYESNRDAFRDVWGSIHGPGAWDANPEVVALTFAIIHHRNIDAIAMERAI